MSDYLTFSEAAEFLSTPRSTLYRWLREGRVPGHKLGRQWRFLREELELVRTGGAESGSPLDPLRAHLSPRTGDSAMSPSALAAELVWEAADRGASAVHLAPMDGGHELRYRTEAGMENVLALSPETFHALDARWRKDSRAIREEGRRRFFLERADPDEKMQVGYRSIETLSGPRVTLRLLREARTGVTLDRIATEEVAGRLRGWCGASHGVIVVSGRSGSGKTTTAYSCLKELADGSRVVFSVEESIGHYLPGVDQVEVDLSDEGAMRRTFSAVMDSDPDVLFLASSIAQPHQHLVCGHALSVAEAGHLVLIQMEADSAADALERFAAAAGRPVEHSLVGVVWQELVPEPGGGRVARYEMVG